MIKILPLLLFFSSVVAADVQTTLEPGSGSVEFNAIGRPSMLKIVGKGPGPTGTLKASEKGCTGDFEVQLKDLTTGISLRDTHMKEKYLQVEQYPTADFKLTKMELPKALDESDASFKDVPFEGIFKLHGVEKPVKGTADLAVENKKLMGTAKFEVKVSDYKIDVPKFAGITMAEDVKVTVRGAGPIAESGSKK